VLDFGTDVISPIALPQYPLDRSNEPLGAAVKLVVEPEPPEQDLDFTLGLNFGDSTKRERDDKPLGIGCDGGEHSRSLPSRFYCPGPPRLRIQYRFRMAAGSSR
jgi:hypothetical protein